MRCITTESPVHFAAQPRHITIKAPRMAGHSRKRKGAPYAEAPVQDGIACKQHYTQR
ncbi:hypothetical protein FVW20_05085 [Desulfovibrio oxamicus]|uniref:Uncharacterized protein n=1 Tax=Nitratidesulfovibrio oxamicus TaxID=32016 RepID=A0ABS0J2N5_9BACT|nr:hypothetical protein [Nitratidesulfovibrio oxamicus]